MAINPSELQSKLAAIPIGQKVMAVAGVAAMIAVVIAVVLWANQPVYHLLYANLSPEDAGTITEKLRGIIFMTLCEPQSSTIPEFSLFLHRH